MANDFDLGKSTSYAYYVSEGGTKTPKEFGEMLVNIDTVASRAEESASDAEESATSANESKESAIGAKDIAIAKANEASASADIALNKAGEASASATTASTKASEASASATTASAKATESSQNALTAVGAKNDAVSAKNDAVTAKTQAVSAKDDAVSAKLGAESARDEVQSSADQITQNASDISQLKSDLNEVLGIESTELFSFEYVSGTSKYDVDSTYQWSWGNTKLIDGTIISRVVMDTNLSDNTEVTATFALYHVNASKNFTRYTSEECTGVAIGGKITFKMNLCADGESVLGFYSDSTFAITITASEESYKVWYATKGLETGTFTKAGNFGILAKWYSDSNIIEDLDKRVTAIENGELSVLTKEIHVGEGLQYEEIQDALDSLTTNYATIIVHPKNTPYGRFSLMRSLTGSYPWSGLTTVKHISIIGVDKAKCVIQSDTGNYDSPPAEIATNGIIKNLTFIATHTDSDGSETTGSYAVHVDNRPADENGMKLIFENCDFISYQTAAVGLGLYRNQDILFDSCNFKSVTDPTWKPNENYDSAYMCALGAYFMHTTMGYAGGNMFIRFRNCFLYHEGGAYTMRIADADSTQTALLEAINNTLWNGTDQNTGYHTTGNPIMQMQYNHGNNATGLNA